MTSIEYDLDLTGGLMDVSAMDISLIEVSVYVDLFSVHMKLIIAHRSAT